MSDGAPIAPAGVEKLWPLIRPISRQNRAFMNRVVSAAMDAGIRQFVDLGSGVPTAGNAKTRRTGRGSSSGTSAAPGRSSPTR